MLEENLTAFLLIRGEPGNGSSGKKVVTFRPPQRRRGEREGILRPPYNFHENGRMAERARESVSGKPENENFSVSHIGGMICVVVRSCLTAGGN